MRTLPYALALTLLGAPAVFVTDPARAQAHSHAPGHKGPNGGPMQDIAGIEAELILAEQTITVNLFDEAGKPVQAAGYSGSVLVGSGQGRQVVQLAPGAASSLSGTAAAAVARGTAMMLQLKAPGGKTGQARY